MTLLGSLAGSENEADRDRLTGETQTSVIEFSHVHGSLRKRTKTQRSDQSEGFIPFRQRNSAFVKNRPVGSKG